MSKVGRRQPMNPAVEVAESGDGASALSQAIQGESNEGERQPPACNTAARGAKQRLRAATLRESHLAPEDKPKANKATSRRDARCGLALGRGALIRAARLERGSGGTFSPAEQTGGRGADRAERRRRRRRRHR